MGEGKIVKLVVLSGGHKNTYAIGVTPSDCEKGVVERIVYDSTGKIYVVILNNYLEIEILTKDILVYRQY